MLACIEGTSTFCLLSLRVTSLQMVEGGGEATGLWSTAPEVRDQSEDRKSDSVCRSSHSQPLLVLEQLEDRGEERRGLHQALDPGRPQDGQGGRLLPFRVVTSQTETCENK